MSDNCPPRPYYLYGDGLTDCEYLQESDIQKAQLRERAYHSRAQRPPFKSMHIGKFGYAHRQPTSRRNPMDYCSNPSALGVPALYKTHSYGVSQHTGRGRLQRENEKNFNDSRVRASFTSQGRQSYPLGLGDNNFWEDLWTLQVLALWLTDGTGWKTNFPGQVGIVSNQGYRPSDVSTLRPTASGRVTLDLEPILRPQNNKNKKTILGPDGIYGVGSDSVLAEYIRTGKIFGASVPSSVRPAVDRLARGITSPAIDKANRDRQVGNTAPQTSAASMDPTKLSGVAQVAAGFTQTKPDRTIGQTWSNFTPINLTGILARPVPGFTPPSGGTTGGGVGTKAAEQPAETTKAAETDSKEKGKKEEDKKEEDNTMLYVGLGIGAVALIGGVIYFANQQKKKKQGLA